MTHEFEGRLAVVTGASSGIGLAVATRLLSQGARVLVMSRRMGELEELAERFEQQLTWIAGDVAQANDLGRLAEQAAVLGPVHYLLPNAGIAELADGLDALAFERQWAVNGAGALNTLSHLHQHLAKPAAVVFIGTFLTEITFPGLAAYIASKSALKAHARTLAVELAPQGIRVNMVSPGPTATPIWSTLGLAQADLATVANQVNQRLLGGQFLDPGAVADVILFLLSQGARSVYGQDWVVDNGYTVR
ncbi:SDR family NAD(P)-dependent oxidoreductase [Pseudomonas gingeri]|uniref:SDR family NAD(P)-dependent oxidoreductase n=1 Tax=Pseudomonas gingeri TaxID=117681 RepID=UPI0015A3E7FC|nr:SDR family oxidoreductase [Pseudomonas gingeri]NWA05807.1 SDR family oxidoreductase [Pseudomonas gingeri]